MMKDEELIKELKKKDAPSFSMFKWSPPGKHLGLDALIETIGSKLLGWELYGYRGRMNKQTEKRMIQLRFVVINMLRLLDHPSHKFLDFCRKKEAYNQKIKRYACSPVTELVIKVMDEMIAVGLVEQHLGYKNINKGYGFVTKVRPTPALVSLFENLSQVEIFHVIGTELVLLREGKIGGKTGPLVDYKDTPEIAERREELVRYNEWVAGMDIQAPGRVLSKRTHRVFNESTFDSGGRFYGASWHNMKSTLRKQITINGKSVVELDYSSIFLTIAYAISDKDMPEGDFYYLPGIPRGRVKKINMYCLGGRQRHACTVTIKKKFGLDKSVVDAYIEKHAAIAGDWFFKSRVLYLMRKEASIASRILRWARERNIPVLPVHDSFITTEDHREDLKTMMIGAFQMEVGKMIVPEIA